MHHAQSVTHAAYVIVIDELCCRPEQAVANLNCFLVEVGLKLEIVGLNPQTPAQASVFDYQHMSPQEMMELEEQHR